MNCPTILYSAIAFRKLNEEVIFLISVIFWNACVKCSTETQSTRLVNDFAEHLHLIRSRPWRKLVAYDDSTSNGAM
jgi:hypothetical protein